MTVIGIDPGLDGAFATIVDGAPVFRIMPVCEVHVKARKSKTQRLVDHQGVVEVLDFYRQTVPDPFYLLERVWSRKGEAASSAFSFGTGYGAIQGILTARSENWGLVLSPKWTSIFVPAKGEDYQVVLRERLSHLDIRKNSRCKNPHEGVVDALGIHLFAMSRLEHGGTLDDLRVRHCQNAGT